MKILYIFFALMLILLGILIFINDSFESGLVFVGLVCLVVFLFHFLSKKQKKENELYIVKGKCIAKYSSQNGNYSGGSYKGIGLGHGYSNTWFHITIEERNGERKVLKCSGDLFGLIFEGEDAEFSCYKIQNELYVNEIVRLKTEEQ